jgi:dihydroorotate dehydrogenase
MSVLHDLGARALHLLDPEDAHRAAIDSLKRGYGPKAPPDDPMLRTVVAGLHLPNPIGLAAGFDKDAEVPDAMLAAGFGFVECGTVTPLAQAGNPRPRLFRLSQDRAVINRMGFNNKGLEAFAARLQGRPRKGIVGANLGANKDAEDRVADYTAGLKRLWGLCDYFTVNVSSPNTPGLRALQSKEALDHLGERIARTREGLEGATPIFLKIAPDLEDFELEAVVEGAAAHGFDGLIVSNTTVARPSDLKSKQAREAGGLSGAPLFEPSTARLKLAAELAKGRLVLIGAGGVSSGAEAYAKLRAGASAVQLYSALVYGGPGLVQRIKHDLCRILADNGYATVAAAVKRS